MHELSDYRNEIQRHGHIGRCWWWTVAVADTERRPVNAMAVSGAGPFTSRGVEIDGESYTRIQFGRCWTEAGAKSAAAIAALKQRKKALKHRSNDPKPYTRPWSRIFEDFVDLESRRGRFGRRHAVEYWDNTNSYDGDHGFRFFYTRQAAVRFGKRHQKGT